MVRSVFGSSRCHNVPRTPLMCYANKIREILSSFFPSFFFCSFSSNEYDVLSLPDPISSSKIVHLLSCERLCVHVLQNEHSFICLFPCEWLSMPLLTHLQVIISPFLARSVFLIHGLYPMEPSSFFFRCFFDSKIIHKFYKQWWGVVGESLVSDQRKQRHNENYKFSSDESEWDKHTPNFGTCFRLTFTFWFLFHEFTDNLL